MLIVQSLEIGIVAFAESRTNDNREICRPSLRFEIFFNIFFPIGAVLDIDGIGILKRI